MIEMKKFIDKIRKKKIFQASVAYTIGGYLLKGLGFITVPIFSRLLSTADFGTYNTFLSYEAILYLFISYALHVSIKNARFDFGMDKLDEYISNISLLPLITSAFGLFVVNVFSGYLEATWGLNRLALNLLVIYSYCSGLIILYQNRLVIEYKYKRYLQITYFNALTNIALSLFLIESVFVNEKYMGRIIGTVAPAVIVSVLILFTFYRKHIPHLNKEHLTYGLKLSLPIIPHGLGQIVLSSFDRIMITNLVGAEESGIYSFSYTIFTMLQVTATALFSVFEPWAYERLKDNRSTELRRMASLFLVFLSVASIGVIVLAPEVIVLLGSTKYADAIYTTIPVIVGGLFCLAYGIPAIIEYYYKKTIYISIGTIGAAAVNVILNAVCIPKYGYIAAAYTTLASYVLYYAFHSIISYKIAGFTIIPVAVIGFCFAMVFACAVITFATLDMPLARYLILCVLLLSVVGLLFFNKDKVKTMLRGSGE